MLWIGTETGLVLFDIKDESFEVLNSQNTSILNEVVKCVYSKNPGYVYFGTDLGLYEYGLPSKFVTIFVKPLF